MGSKRIGARWLGSLIVAAAVMTACSDSSTAPTSIASKLSSQPTMALNDAVNNSVVIGQLKICKLGNASGTFTVARTTFGTSTGSAQNPTTVAPADPCRIAVLDGSDANTQNGSFVIVTEQALPANTVGEFVSCVGDCTSNTAGATVTVNSAHGGVITYRNTFTPPVTTGCTFTKGWYRNHGSNSVTAADGRTKAQNQAIMDATPGKPGSVTWGVNNDPNDLLNLYQQLLSAIFNLGGVSGPAPVNAAIAAALAGTGGTGLNITTTLNQTQISTLIGVLSDFNEGNFAGWPHCDD